MKRKLGHDGSHEAFPNGIFTDTSRVGSRLVEGPRFGADLDGRSTARPRGPVPAQTARARATSGILAAVGEWVAVARGVAKWFGSGRAAVRVLDGVDLEVPRGELVGIVGRSGSGKSTLLHLLGGLDRPDAGTIEVDGRSLAEVDAAEYRAGTVGFVFQFHDLIPTLSALENVQVPMLGRTLARSERGRRARELLAQVGLADRAGSSPRVLSGGERQRVALARALANEPRLLLADEPTGSLDSGNGAHVLELLQRLRGEHGMTVLLVTNDENVAAAADRTLRLLDGVVTADGAPMTDGTPPNEAK